MYSFLFLFKKTGKTLLLLFFKSNIYSFKGGRTALKNGPSIKLRRQHVLGGEGCPRVPMVLNEWSQRQI